jgi:hypothetical protein
LRCRMRPLPRLSNYPLVSAPRRLAPRFSSRCGARAAHGMRLTRGRGGLIFARGSAAMQRLMLS